MDDRVGPEDPGEFRIEAEVREDEGVRLRRARYGSEDHRINDERLRRLGPKYRVEAVVPGDFSPDVSIRYKGAPVRREDRRIVGEVTDVRVDDDGIEVELSFLNSPEGRRYFDTVRLHPQDYSFRIDIPAEASEDYGVRLEALARGAAEDDRIRREGADAGALDPGVSSE